MKFTCAIPKVINSCLRAPIILQKSISWQILLLIARAMSSWVDAIANSLAVRGIVAKVEFVNFGAQTVQCASICVIR